MIEDAHGGNEFHSKAGVQLPWIETVPAMSERGQLAPSYTLSTSAMMVCNPLAPAGCGRTISAICNCPLLSHARTTVWYLPRLGGLHT